MTISTKSRIEDAKIASLEKSLRAAEQVRTEAEFRLMRSETVVRRALVEKAAAQLREVDAQQDVIKRLRAAADRRNAERAVERAEAPFEEARQQVETADETIHSILEQLVAAREQQADLAVK